MNISTISKVMITFGIGYSLPVPADSWTIIQSVSPSTNTTIYQQSTIRSVQALNSIHLDSNNGIITKANQTLNMGGRDLTLKQENTSSSKQAVNSISAARVTDATQSLLDAGSIILSQTSGNNSLQVINAVVTSGAGSQIDVLDQSVSADSVTFSHQGGGSSNIQGGNYIEAGSTSSIDNSLVQNFNVTTLNFIQGGTNNVQAGNILIKRPGYTGGAVQQNFSAESVAASFSNTDANGSVAAANYIIQR